MDTYKEARSKPETGMMTTDELNLTLPHVVGCLEAYWEGLDANWERKRKRVHADIESLKRWLNQQKNSRFR